MLNPSLCTAHPDATLVTTHAMTDFLLLLIAVLCLVYLLAAVLRPEKY